MESAHPAPVPRDGAARTDLRLSLQWLVAGIWGGTIAGFVIGGLGGRLAMLVLRLTSDPSLNGRETDDGFIIGSITGDSFFLIGLCTVAGLVGGLFYLAVRPWIPPRWRIPGMAMYGAAVGGAGIIRPDGIDFTELDPLALAVVMFVALPALYGAAMSWLVERFLQREPKGTSRSTGVVLILGLLPLALGGPLGLGILIAAGVLWALNRQLNGVLTNLWRSDVVTWLGRVALLGATAWAFVILVDDIFTVL